ncbi:MAG: PHP domain-containing protein [Clostridia bacterium]|nr:PHP domain-containing protein [Clostridia bacterium]
MFKTELHCHSNDVSACARVDVETITKRFIDGGYSTIVLTNHLGDFTYDHLHATDWDSLVDAFVGGYKKLKAHAEGKLNILLGMELRFKHNANDYLVFGPDEEFLREHPFIYNMKVWEFHKICQEKGYLLIQAHPFRNGMTVNAPHDIDGVEVFNGHKGHDSRNDIAEMWADKYNLIKTSGTDFHYPDVPTNAGIMTECEITSMTQLVEIIKSGNYTLIRLGEYENN